MASPAFGTSSFSTSNLGMITGNLTIFRNTLLRPRNINGCVTGLMNILGFYLFILKKFMHKSLLIQLNLSVFNWEITTVFISRFKFLQAHIPFVLLNEHPSSEVRLMLWKSLQYITVCIFLSPCLAFCAEKTDQNVVGLFLVCNIMYLTRIGKHINSVFFLLQQDSVVL